MLPEKRETNVGTPAATGLSDATPGVKNLGGALVLWHGGALLCVGLSSLLLLLPVTEAHSPEP